MMKMMMMMMKMMMIFLILSCECYESYKNHCASGASTCTDGSMGIDEVADLETVLLGDLLKNVDEVESGGIEAAAVERRQRFPRFPFDVLEELRHSLSSLIVQRLDLLAVLKRRSQRQRQD